MGNCHQKINRKEKPAEKGEETFYADVKPLENTMPKEELLYATIDHGNPSKTDQPIKFEDDSCAYAQVTVPAAKTINNSMDDCDYAQVTVPAAKTINNSMDDCDYAQVTIPAVKTKNSLVEDCSDDYVLMG
ncbi:uncharacterized protein si:ch211-214p13.7 isoform X2 [Erpetoichthys calabaricus]|uniref:uncharacterized protein si:ch211-214p13.7 isoform X2 n=1 Tax=Erpetoichthys calabaricus TaxID=27687 RepID=UPI0022346F6A|nr:uncharacterized protein si:ch211-214p13.7 isoform X2 [Erpetoichthys calabaricus]